MCYMWMVWVWVWLCREMMSSISVMIWVSLIMIMRVVSECL